MRNIWEGYVKVGPLKESSRAQVVVEDGEINVCLLFGDAGHAVPSYVRQDIIDEALRCSMRRAGHASTVAAAASQALKAGKDPAEVCAALIRACIDGPVA